MPQINLVVSNEMSARLQRLISEGKMKDDAELFANMVALWDWAAMRSSEGKAIVALDKIQNAYNELDLPSLTNIQTNAQAAKALRDAGFKEEEKK